MPCFQDTKCLLRKAKQCYTLSMKAKVKPAVKTAKAKKTATKTPARTGKLQRLIKGIINKVIPVTTLIKVHNKEISIIHTSKLRRSFIEARRIFSSGGFVYRSTLGQLTTKREIIKEYNHDYK